MKRFLTIAIISNFILINNIGTSMSDNIQIDKNLNDLLNDGYRIKFVNTNDDYILYVLEKEKLKIGAITVEDVDIPIKTFIISTVICKTQIEDLSITKCVLP